jgi:hypothetical protein
MTPSLEARIEASRADINLVRVTKSDPPAWQVTMRLDALWVASDYHRSLIAAYEDAVTKFEVQLAPYKIAAAKLDAQIAEVMAMPLPSEATDDIDLEGLLG